MVRKSVRPESFRGKLCTQVAKIAAYCDCGHPEKAKPHAIELQKMLIEHGLLVDGSVDGCHNDHQIGET